MVSPNKNKAPQQANPARQAEDLLVHEIADTTHTGKPSLLGQAPAGLEMRFSTAPSGQLPEFYKLPSPHARCPYTGASRSWLLDMEKRGLVKIVRVRRPGKMRGACFVFLPSVLGLLRSALDK